MKKIIFILTLISFIILTGCESKKEENTSELLENNGMLSYTIDGEIAKEKPTKESGYIVNSIKCDNSSILVWDNDNWVVELVEPKGSDRCIVDFTKDISKEGYRVTATSNIENVLDSYSKATTNGGTVEIYAKNEIEIKSISGCTGTVENNKVVITNVTQNQTCNIEIEPTLANYVKLAYKPQPGRTNFSVIDDGDPSLYKGIDDQGTTYYFSGDGTNMKNWVKFADKWWRIIRINGNGSIKLLYAGDGNDATDIGKSVFNSTEDHPAYVGWKYDTNGNNGRGNTPSGAYNTVDSWYTVNIIDAKLVDYIDKNVVYCNDRELKSGYSYGTSGTFYYAPYERLTATSPNPIFNCISTIDSFKDGFGLMTADEVAFAGGKFGTSNSKAYYYLNALGNGSITGNQGWWTMSPSYFSSDKTLVMYIFGSRDPGRLGNSVVYADKVVVRPVISLKKEVQVTKGDGSDSKPYEVTLN